MSNLNLSIGILCGGKSKRFGTDKTFHKINGKTILEIVIDKFQGLSNDIFLQTSNNDSERLKKFSSEVSFHHDTVKDKGALGGIYSALIHAKHNRVFIIAGDLPFIDNEILIQLNSLNDAQLVVPRWDNGFIEPLCAIYSKDLKFVIQEQMDANDLKINNLYKVIEENHAKKMMIQYVNIDQLIRNNKINEDCFKNINCLKDLHD